ncbi:MAG: NUDIX domain-containing protein [Parcubacteria group bacterium]|nr:NUDIX domain-containing protein [Parcubacteria group bacterium]
MKKEKEIQATLVVAGLLRNLATREIGLVDRKRKLTLPTGHIDPSKDNTPEEALIREMKEEFPELETLEIIQSLGTVVRNKSSPPVSIEIFSCNVRADKITSYTEGNFVAWIRPPEALKLPYLDILAREALKRYVKKYPGIKKEE